MVMADMVSQSGEINLIGVTIGKRSIKQGGRIQGVDARLLKSSELAAIASSTIVMPVSSVLVNTSPSKSHESTVAMMGCRSSTIELKEADRLLSDKVTSNWPKTWPHSTSIKSSPQVFSVAGKGAPDKIKTGSRTRLHPAVMYSIITDGEQL